MLTYWKIEAGFWVMLFCGPGLLLYSFDYTALSYCMIVIGVIFARFFKVCILIQFWIVLVCN